MPVYEYICPKCGNKKEIVSSISNYNGKAVCDCGEIMKRIISKPALIQIK